jgi:hypothetical protein
MFKMNSGGIRFSVDDFLIRKESQFPLGKFFLVKAKNALSILAIVTKVFKYCELP